MRLFVLLKIANISLSTSNAMAVQRLNTYLGILEKYKVITKKITYIADDIKNDKLLKFRLHHFEQINLDIDNEEEYEDEKTSGYLYFKSNSQYRFQCDFDITWLKFY